MEMTKKEEMAYAITNFALKNKNGEPVGSVADNYARQIAEVLYNAGYRKIDGDEYVSREWHDEQILHAESEVLTRDKSNLERTLEEGGEELQATKASLERMTDNYKAILKHCAHLRQALAERKDYIADLQKFTSEVQVKSVKEFAEWVKDHIPDVPFCNQKAYNIFCDMVNEKLKEYEK
jgi:hypothetical protein